MRSGQVKSPQPEYQPPNIQDKMKHNTTPAPIRAYGKSELAHLYYGMPVSDNRARAWLMHEMQRYPQLLQQLADLGYTKSTKVFTPAQVRAIFSAMGRPGSTP